MSSTTRISITELQQKIERFKGDVRKEVLSCSSLSGGIPRGSLVELAGSGKVEWLADFLREHPEFKIFWIESSFTIFPTALRQRGLNLDQIVFAQAESDDLFKAIRKALRSHAFGFVIAPSVFSEERFLRTLQLLAEKSNTTVFLLARRFRASWPISVQLKVDREPSGEGFSVRIHKHKGLSG